MGKHPKGIRKYNIKDITHRQHEIKRFMVLGYTNIEISRMFDISTQEISNIRCSPIMQKQLETLSMIRDSDVVDTSDIKRNISALSVRAVEVLEDCMEDSHDDKIKLSAAKDILDRAGYGAVQKSSMMVGIVTSEDIAKIKQRISAQQADMADVNVREVVNG